MCLPLSLRGIRNVVATSRSTENKEQPYLFPDEPQRQKSSDSLNLPLEAHWQLPQVGAKSSSKRSSRYFNGSFKRKGSSDTLRKVVEGTHDPKDELLVKAFRELLMLEGLLPKKHDDYHTLLRYVRLTTLR